MSDVIIRVDGLGKKYTISHENPGGYTALRDVISSKAKRLIKGRRNLPTKEDFWALKNVSFEIKQGDAVGIIGRNGAGKSTLLKILSRITEPSKGRIEINGRIASLLEVGTGFHPELTGRENIFLNGAILGMSRAEIKRKFDEIVDFSGVEKFLDTPVKRYSSGMYVRLAFAVAAYLEPEILVVDEVLAVGDTEFQKKCLGKMEEVSKSEGRTVLFVSHQLGMVSELCNKSIVLEKGQVAMMDTTANAIDYYLNNQVSESLYRNKLSDNSRPAYLSELKLINTGGELVSEIEHYNGIVLEMDVVVNKYNAAYGIGLAMLDKYKKRVFTINFNIGKYFSNDIGVKKLRIYFPPNFFIPGNYSWTYSVNLNFFEVFDFNLDCCSFKIIDAGSEFSAYENQDRGVVFMRDYEIKIL